MKNLEDLFARLAPVISQGRELAAKGSIPRSSIDFWVMDVAQMLRDLPNGRGIEAEWQAIPDSDTSIVADPRERGMWGVNNRLAWLQKKIGELVTASAEDQRRVEEREQAENIAEALEGAREHATGEPPSKAQGDSHTVFVVHGRDLALRDSMFVFLRAIGLHPLEWTEATRATGKATPYIGEILEAAFSRAQGVVVLMTPDDEARLMAHLQKESDLEHERELTPQARPNVLFEAGMAMGRFPDRTVLVEVGKLRPFSDIGGRHVIRFDGSSQRRQELAQRLKDVGCAVNLEGTDWHTAGRFDVSLQED